MSEEIVGSLDAIGSQKPAGFWLRAGAYIIDGLVCGILSLVPGVLLILVFPKSHKMALFANFLNVAVGMIYFTYMTAACGGQTVGKRSAGIAVIRTDGSKISYSRALLRCVGYYISTLTAMIGFLMAAFTDRKRALHDFIADTRVVQVHAVSGVRKFFVVAAGLVFPGVAVLGIGSAILIPVLARYQTRAQDALALSNLYVLRNSAELYYNDHQSYPGDLAAIIQEQHVQKISVAGHSATDEVHLYGNEVCSGTSVSDAAIMGTKLIDTGGWGYVNNPKSPCFGKVFISCTHTRPGLKEWYRY